MAYEVLANKSPNFLLSEGPHWDAKSGHLYFVDIFGRSVSKLDYDTGKVKTNVIETASFVSSVLPREGKTSVIITVGPDICSYDIETDKMDVIFKVEPGNELRLNDSKCDSLGRIWTGSMALETSPGVVPPNRGNMFSYDSSGVLKKHEDKIDISNGFAWSLDSKTLYYIDSCRRNVVAYDCDIDGPAISNRRVCIDFAKTEPNDTLPDGMCVDAEDKLWVALYRGWKVVRCDPKTGEIIQSIKLPAAQITSCCFAGKNLDDLIVTSARMGLTEEDLKKQPLAGSVFRIKNVGVKGLPGVAFNG